MSRGSLSRDRAALHRVAEEGRPGELEGARARPRGHARLLLARRAAGPGEQALLGDQHAVALHVVIVDVEDVVDDGDQRLRPGRHRRR